MNRAVSLAPLVWVVASCGLSASPSPTFQDGVEALPGPGYFHVVGDPAVAQRSFVIHSLLPDGEESGVSDTMTDGRPVEFDGVTFPGQVGLIVDGVRCDGRFPIESDRMTEVVLHLADDGCRVTSGAVHAVDPP